MAELDISCVNSEGNKSRRYGIIGNCTFGAIIDDRARCVWACPANFGSDCIYNSLLNNNSDEGGFFDVVIDNFSHSEQHYEFNSSVLVTTLHSLNGDAVEIRDFAPRFEIYDRLHCPFQMFRRLTKIKGDPLIKIRIRPTFSYNSSEGLITRGSHHIRFCGTQETWRVTTNISITCILEETFILMQKSIFLVHSTDELIQSSLDDLTYEFERKTTSFWNQWSINLVLPLEYHYVLVRTAICLKLMQSEDTGGFISSLTIGIPFQEGGTPTRDFRIYRLLDEVMGIAVLRSFGLMNMSRLFLSFLKNITFKKSRSQIEYIENYKEEKEATKANFLAGYHGTGKVELYGISRDFAGVSSPVLMGLLILALVQIFFDNRLKELATAQLLSNLQNNGDMAFQYFCSLVKTLRPILHEENEEWKMEERREDRRVDERRGDGGEEKRDTEGETTHPSQMDDSRPMKCPIVYSTCHIEKAESFFDDAPFALLSRSSLEDDCYKKLLRVRMNGLTSRNPYRGLFDAMKNQSSHGVTHSDETSQVSGEISKSLGEGEGDETEERREKNEGADNLLKPVPVVWDENIVDYAKDLDLLDGDYVFAPQKLTTGKPCKIDSSIMSHWSETQILGELAEGLPEIHPERWERFLPYGFPPIHTLTTIMCWVAANRLSRLYTHLNRPKAAYIWEKRADAMRAIIFRLSIHPQKECLVTYWRGNCTGPSLLRTSELGFLSSSDAIFVNTVRSFEKDASVSCGLDYNVILESINKAVSMTVDARRRQETSATSRPPSWQIFLRTHCRTFATNTLLWYVEALRATGRKMEAKTLFDSIIDNCYNTEHIFRQSIVMGQKQQGGNIPCVVSLINIIRCGCRLSETWISL